jgi:hypothetical protein
MGYLDNSSITVDAILTLKGRELLSQGGNAFNITQFALADDEIDYSLWNTDHPLGTDYYGVLIENLPLTEAVPDESQMMRYKLISLPKSTTNIPVITVGESSITLTTAGASSVITPNTANIQNGNSNLGYTAILSDSTVADLQISQPIQSNTNISPTVVGVNSDAQTVSAVGFAFQVVAKPQYVEDKTATITIVGNETGGSVTINLTVNKITAVNPATGVSS